jgi:hypothetical protein
MNQTAGTTVDRPRVVVGTDGFAELLLGSVGVACVHHARRPLTVVPQISVDTVKDTEVVASAAPQVECMFDASSIATVPRESPSSTP